MKKAIVSCIILMLALSLTGCFWEGEPPPSNTVKQVNPIEEASNREKVPITLYFQYGDAYLLAGEPRVIEVPVNGRLEISALKELIKGPSPDYRGFTAVLNPSVKVVSVSDSGEYLFVTLSREFLPEGQPELPDADKKKQQLAVYAIANTLIELGGYSRVQILVDADNNGLGQRVKMSDAGFGTGNDALLEPVGFNSSIVLNPKNTAKEFLKSYEGKDYESMYGLIAYRDLDGNVRPSEEEFLSGVVSFNSGIEKYSVVDYYMAPDGLSCVVLIDFSVIRKNGTPLQKDNTPLKLIREEGIWKISYDSFIKVFQL